MKKKACCAGLCVAITAAVILSCSGKSDSPSGPGGGDGVRAEWKTGASASYTVTGGGETGVADSLTGATFVIGQGSGGTLTVSAVEDGPSIPFAGTRFHVDYTGGGAVTVELAADPDGGDTWLLSHGALENAHIDEMTGNVAWWGVPPYAEEEGVLSYRVSLEAPDAAKRAAAPVDANNFAIVRAGRGSGDFNHLRTIHRTVQEVIDTWLDNLPAGTAETVRNRIANLSRTVMWTSGGNAYKHVTGIFSPRVILFFNPSADLSSIAHETGHYICHAILGDGGYSDLYGRFPTDFRGTAVSHDLGAYRPGRAEILEDYPYISMILTTGDLVNYDLTSVAKFNNVRDMTGAADPAIVDYPSHEAFGAAMLMSLRRTESAIYSFTKAARQETADVPVVGASWEDILNILARGPKDVNELRRYIQDFLDTRSDDRYKFSAMMEPLGWSYHGTGTIVDDAGDPFSGAAAQNIYQDGTREYRTTASVSTGADGAFTLNRIFPGSSILRVFHTTDAGPDSTDFPLFVDWKTATGESQSLGEFALERRMKDFPLSFSHSYVLTPGIRAQNRLSVSGEGALTGPENMFVYPQFNASSGVLDVQSIIGLNQEATVDMDLTYDLAKGTSWETSLSSGDYGNAVKAVTTLSNPSFKLIEAFGPEGARSERYLSPPDLLYHITAATAAGQYYRADIRLEWDYEQVYYTKDGDEAGRDSGKTGVYFLHIYRDVSGTM